MYFSFILLWLFVWLQGILSLHHPSTSIQHLPLAAVVSIPLTRNSTTSPPNPLPAVLASSFCVATFLYPLDLIRTLQMSAAVHATRQSTYQLLAHFISTHGYRGLVTQGLAAEILRATWIRFIKFGTFPAVRRIVSRYCDHLSPPSAAVIAAMLVSIPEVLTTMPLEVAKLALQLDTSKRLKNSLLHALAHVYDTYGVVGLYSGYVAVQFRNAAWSAVYFSSLPSISRLVQRLRSVFPLQVIFFPLVSGFLAGVLGTLFNTPFDNIRLCMQRSMLIGYPSSGNIVSAIRQIVSIRGWRGLYTGLLPKALQLGAGGALMAVLQPLFQLVFSRISESMMRRHDMIKLA